MFVCPYTVSIKKYGKVLFKKYFLVLSDFQLTWKMTKRSNMRNTTSLVCQVSSFDFICRHQFHLLVLYILIFISVKSYCHRSSPHPSADNDRLQQSTLISYKHGIFYIGNILQTGILRPCFSSQGFLQHMFSLVSVFDPEDNACRLVCYALIHPYDLLYHHPMRMHLNRWLLIILLN